MHDAAERLTALDSMASHWIRIVGIGIESFGVLVIVAGIAWSTFRFFTTADGRAALRCVQDPYWSISPARPRGPGGGRHREDDRVGADIHESRPARWPRAG